ncbi:MAG TPA: nucleotide exchange factor GrpE [Nitrospiria bacterium]|jgi:molecular chaperone GrpE|nr:nucleotide exchange factor GrpE [Nitrospiria bacterium]
MEDQTPNRKSDTESSEPTEVSSGSKAAEPASLEQEIQSLKTELDFKSKELAAAQEKQLRVLAEMENYKKRTARDQMEQLRYANEKLLKELLPVLDNLERALSHVKDASERSPWIEGVELTYRQFLDVLKKFGVTPITSVGEIFDPGRHQAVTYLDTTEQPENHVAEELQKGYLYHERVLRPSMVAVARRPSHSPVTEAPEKKAPEEDSQNP